MAGVRILFVSSRLPYPPWQGDRLRAYNFLRLLSRRHAVVLVTPMRREERGGLEAVRPFCERIEPIEDSSWRGSLRLLASPFTPLPFQTLLYFPSGVREKVRNLLREEPFDLVHIQTMRMGPAAQAASAAPAVLDLLDAFSLNMKRRARRERGLMRLLCDQEARRVLDYERALLKRFAAVMISSPEDGKAIAPNASLSIVPNGVDLARFPFVARGREPHIIVFAGRMAYFANADAAAYFASQVFPLIRQRIPEARFLIVGAEPRRKVRLLGRLPGVSVTGQVESIHHYLGKATLSVAPMRAGSGMQNKILEAMASGAPVVATPCALGGIAAQAEEHLLVGDTAEKLAHQCLRLMTDPSLAGRLASNARRLVEEHYTWERSVELLESVYQQAVARYERR